MSSKKYKDNKIFIIGFNKCGTVTLSSFFQRNGIPILHWIDQYRRNLALQMDEKLKQGKPLLEDYNDYQVFADMTHISETKFIEMNKYFELLDQQYPNSKFILNIRPIDNWVLSRLKHFNRRTGSMLERFKKVYGINDKETIVNMWRKDWADHLQNVQEYFQGTDKLFIYDIEKDDPQKIIDFFPELNLDHRHYEHMNKTTHTLYDVEEFYRSGRIF